MNDAEVWKSLPWFIKLAFGVIGFCIAILTGIVILGIAGHL